jgi:hypothetical protein
MASPRDPHVVALERRLLLWMCVLCVALLLAICQPEMLQALFFAGTP